MTKSQERTDGDRMKNKPFWINLMASWQGKRLLIGVFYRNLSWARRQCRKGQAVYKVTGGYMVAKGIV